MLDAPCTLRYGSPRSCDVIASSVAGPGRCIRAIHPEVLIGKKKSTKTTRVAKLNLVRLSEKLIQKFYSNLKEVNEDKALENQENRNPDDDNDASEEEDMDDSSLNFKITETTSIEAIDTMDTELSSECISDTDESSNTEEITTVIENQVSSIKNCEVPDLDLQIIDIKDQPDNQTKLSSMHAEVSIRKYNNGTFTGISQIF